MKKQAPTNAIRYRRKPLISALESRILLDGAAVATTAEMTTDVAFQNEAVHTDSADQSVHFAAPAPTGNEPGNRREVAVVDTSVEDFQSLVEGLDDSMDVILIDGSKNGLAQMVDALQGQTGLDAIHVYSHGDVGELKLGSFVLNSDSLASSAGLLSTLGQSLTENGDLLLYGCYVGAGNEGQQFIDSLAQLTQADVAASVDATGFDGKGGDWSLERAKDVEAEERSSQHYEHLLGVANPDFESGLDNWSTGGTVSDRPSLSHSNSGGDWVIGPADSTMAYLSSAGGEAWSTVSQGALSLGNESKAYIDGQFSDITQISYIHSDVTLAEGEQISFAWNYLANDYAPYNDGSIASFANLTDSGNVGSINGTTSEVVILGATVAGTGNYSTGDYKSTGWQTITFEASTAGTYRVGFSVFDLNDTGYNPFLFVDDRPGTTTLDGMTYDPIEQDPDAPPPPGNSSPVISGTNADLTVGDNATLSPFSSVSLNDANGDNLSLTVSLDSTDKGGFTAASLSASGFTDNGDGTYSLASTSAANAQSALRQLDFEPVENQLVPGATETVVFTVEASDGTDSSSDNGTVLEITSVNDAPEAVDDQGPAVEAGGAANAAQGSNAQGNVLSNDSDIDLFSTLSVSEVRTGAEAGTGTAGTVGQSLTGTYGSLTLNADGSYTYVVDETNAAVQALRVTGQTLSDQFTYRVSDAEGATDQATLTITIDGRNDAPVGTDDSATAVEAGGAENGTAGSDATGNVLSNDGDVDSAGNGETAVVTAVRTGAEAGTGTAGTVGQSLTGTYGSLTLNADGSYTYVVDETNAAVQALRVTGQTLSDQFTYRVSDAEGATDQATLTITIDGRNDAPVGTDDSATAVEAGGAENGTAGSDATGNVLSNDGDVDSAGNGETAAVTAVRSGAEAGTGTAGTVGQSLAGTYGSLTLNADGSYTYVVDETNAAVQALRVTGQTLSDQFTYRVSDAEGATDQATLTITIDGRNDTPMVDDVDMDTIWQQGRDFVLDVSPLFSDVDSSANGESFQFTIEGLPDGLAYDAATGVISGQPSAAGVFDISLTVEDAAGASVTRNFELTIVAFVQDSPVSGNSEPTPPSAPDSDTQTVQNDLSYMPDGLVGDGGSTNDPSDSSGYMEATANSGGEGMQSPSDTTGEVDGGTQILLSEPGALVTQVQNPDGSSSIRASVDVSVGDDGQVVFSEAQQQAFSRVSMSVASIERTTLNGLAINIQDDNAGAAQIYTAGLASGDELPSWIQMDPETGTLMITNPPESQQSVSIRIQAVGADGQVRVLELKLDLEKMMGRASTEAVEPVEPQTGFVPLQGQFEAELAARDGYGERLIAMLQSA